MFLPRIAAVSEDSHDVLERDSASRIPALHRRTPPARFHGSLDHHRYDLPRRDFAAKRPFFWRCYDKNGTTKRQTPYLDVLWGLSLYLLFLLLLLFRQTSLHSFLFICPCSRTCSSFVSETENWKSFPRIWKKKRKQAARCEWAGWRQHTLKFGQMRINMVGHNLEKSVKRKNSRMLMICRS